MKLVITAAITACLSMAASAQTPDPILQDVLSKYGVEPYTYTNDDAIRDMRRGEEALRRYNLEICRHNNYKCAERLARERCANPTLLEQRLGHDRHC